MKKTCVLLLFLVSLVWIVAACGPFDSSPAPDGYMRVTDDAVRYMTWIVNDDKSISGTWSFLIAEGGKSRLYTGSLTGRQDGEKITVTTEAALGVKITSNGTIKDGVMVLNAADKTGAINKVTYNGVTTDEFNQTLAMFKKKYPPAQ